jgi:polysaccharide biosynthesis transport protein
VTGHSDRWVRAGFGAQAVDDADRARRGNRRRLGVFALTFALASLAGQAWNFSRPAEYAASTRVQVSLPEVGRPGMQASSAYATKLQLFDSRPMLAGVAEALTGAGMPAAVLGDDPAGRLRSMLRPWPGPRSSSCTPRGRTRGWSPTC